MGNFKWGYALENGNAGVYKKKNRLWRVKGKFKPINMVYYQKDEKTTYLIIGW